MRRSVCRWCHKPIRVFDDYGHWVHDDTRSVYCDKTTLMKATPRDA